jgi:hypothetical protein
VKNCIVQNPNQGDSVKCPCGISGEVVSSQHSILRILVLTLDSRETLMDHKLKLHLLDEKFVISKMPNFAKLPSVFAEGEMCFMMRSDEDLTIISPEFMAPNNVQQEIGFRCLRTDGEIPMNSVGIVDSLIQPLSAAKISVSVISTFNSVFLFLMEEHLVNATQALQHAGHEFVHED